MAFRRVFLTMHYHMIRVKKVMLPE